MRFIISLLLLFAIVFVGFVFYFSKPKNLGIKYTQEDLKSIHSRLNVKFEPLSKDVSKTGKTLIVAGSHQVDEYFTSQELTAAVDNRNKQYVYFPFNNVQIRVNADGSIEGSATVTYNDAVNYLVALGVSYQDIIKAAAKFNVPKVGFPVYLKASGSIVNNLGHIKIHSANIANIPVPQNFVDQYGPGVNDLIEDVIKDRQPSYNIEKLEIIEGKVHFKGTSPDIEQAVRSL